MNVITCGNSTDQLKCSHIVTCHIGCSCPLCNVHFMKLCKFCWWEIPDRLFESQMFGWIPGFSWLNIVKHHFSWFYLVLHPNDCYLQMLAGFIPMFAGFILSFAEKKWWSTRNVFSQHCWRVETPMFHCIWWLYIISHFSQVDLVKLHLCICVPWSKIAMAHIRGMVINPLPWIYKYIYIYSC